MTIQRSENYPATSSSIRKHELTPKVVQVIADKMSRVVLHLIFLIFFLPLSVVAQQTNGSVSVRSSLTAADGVEPWLSPSGDFAFGFQRIEGQDNFLLSVWYYKIPNKTIIWYPEDGPLVPEGSKVELTTEQGLVLTDPQGTRIWTSESISDPVEYGVMNDTGNFVLVRSDFVNIWESFKFPADTMLPMQVMERGGVIYSQRSRTNFSRGMFQLRLLQDGNLVLNTRDIPSNSAYEAYYISGTYVPSNESNSGYQVKFDPEGYMYILRRNGERFDLTPRGKLPSGDYYHRATLEFDGVFTQYYHPKNFTGNPSWRSIWFEPDNICLDIRANQGAGACGFNNVCSLDDDRRPKCKCPPGYSLLDPSNPYGSCKPNFTQTCDDDEQNGGEDQYDLVELTDTDWPLSDYEHMNPTSKQGCKDSCLNDCFCAVAIYRGNECWKKKLPLSNGRTDRSVNGNAFLKFRKGVPTLPNHPQFPKQEKDQRSLIIVGSALLGCSAVINIVLIGAICLGFFLTYQKKMRNLHRAGSGVEANLRRFTYQELVEATDGFKDVLGKGAFGIVYKGVIGTNSRNVVAVKKLERVFQDGEKEFRTEVKAIGRTHHKNLVQLLGYCDDGENRLLVYEYMSNGTLASFLFGETRPSWKQRSHIALGIARGLSYLHEECSTQIIHCDIKPQNILLDDYFNARISDFGLAKLLMINQSRTNTGIRGTKGYVGPEWFRNTPVTTKVDVYSFGVLLLEIISCRRSLEELENGNEESAILTDWAWDCYLEGRLDTFVDNDLEASDDCKKLEIFVMVGLWCIQEDPSLRPTMRKVIQMLEGVIEVMEPPCPYPYSVTLS